MMDKTNLVLINGKQHALESGEVAFEKIVEIAFPKVKPEHVSSCTVMYTRGDAEKPSGAIVPGQTVKVKSGMEIDAMWTNGA